MSEAEGAHAIDPAWQRVQRVLAVRLDNLGDVLMTTPALHALRECLPAARITLFASPAGLALLPHLPDVADAISYNAPWMKTRQHASAAAPEDLGMLDRLRARRFDAAVIFTCFSQSALPAALMCELAGIPLRLAHCRENPYGLLSHWVHESEPEQGIRHEVARQLALVAAVGCASADTRMRFELREADGQALQRKAAAVGLDPTLPWVVVHPGASAPSRRYPSARFGEAAQRIADARPCRIVFTGAASEASLVQEARAAMQAPSIDLSGALSLGELGALIARAAVLVTNNSGPAHLAAALGTPVVDLYALTNPQHTPWQVASRVLNHDVPCRNCFKSICPEGHQHCLTLVPPAEVADAALALMATARVEAALV